MKSSVTSLVYVNELLMPVIYVVIKSYIKILTVKQRHSSCIEGADCDGNLRFALKCMVFLPILTKMCHYSSYLWRKLILFTY